jgi:hypothetical protein
MHVGFSKIQALASSVGFRKILQRPALHGLHEYMQALWK